MKATRFIFLSAFFLISAISSAQVQEDKATTVNFTDKNIIIGDTKCFNYLKKGNDYTISDLSGKEIIRGAIKKNLDGKFESVIIFLPVGKTFSNKKIVGRNDLIFALVNADVIAKDCSIDIAKLKKFIEEHNEFSQ